jgi:aspartate/methionine/tyrosine aminotransferase
MASMSTPLGPAAERRVSEILANLQPSATLAVDARAKALKAAGENVIGFGAGEPDFATPQAIVDAAVAACLDPKNHKYTPAAGLPELREAVAKKTLRDSGLAVEASQVIITNGGKHAVANTFEALLDPGDEVIIPAPFWTTYPESAALVGGVPIIVPTNESTGFKATVEQLDAAWTPQTKMLVFCSPSNPTGAVYNADEIDAIGAWAGERGVWVMADEIYEHLTYDNTPFVSLPARSSELGDRWVVVNGVAKTYAMTGWRVGWMIGPPDVIAAATNLQSQITSNISNISQRAALAAVSGDLSAVSMMRETFDRRRKTMTSMLNDIEGISCLTPEGAFYCFPNVTGLLGKSFAGRVATTSAELAEFAIDEVKVAVVPGEAFGSPGYFRLSYALGDDDLVEGVTRLAELFKAV